MQRLQGYKDALIETFDSYDENLIVKIDPTYDNGISLGRAISNNELSATAIVTSADIMAIGVMEGAKLNGMSIPKDLSVIGFDNLFPSTIVTPKLTTVSQNIEEKAKAAVNLLMEFIENGFVKNNKITLDVEIIERQSVLHL